jgi:undecaprenyl-diphosphatase
LSHLTYAEAAVVGLLQGVSELFPVSSLGHSVLLPALIGGSWAKDLNVSTPESPYLAFIVGLHVATALALMLFFWRDWVRIIAGFFTSLRYRRVETRDERLAWLIIIATIPVGIAGLLLEHAFRVVFGKPLAAAIFLIVNGLILFLGERLRRAASRQADREELAPPGTDIAVASDERLSRLGVLPATLIGAAQVLALLAGISRSGATMVAGLLKGLSHEDAARFAFLLATPVILAAGVLKIPDLTGPLGKGIGGQVLLGSALSFIGAYMSVRFLTKYFQTRTLTPFAIYCFVLGLGSAIYLGVR